MSFKILELIQKKKKLVQKNNNINQRLMIIPIYAIKQTKKLIHLQKVVIKLK